MTLLKAITLLGACNPLVTQNNATQNTTFIGYYVETSPVNSEMWIRIDEEEEDILFVADAAGRDILVNFGQDGSPVLFYKATPELGRIVGYREIRNDYGSLVYMINKLSDYAESAHFSNDPDGDVLGYIRSFKSSYCSVKWNLIAGRINDSFVQSVRAKPHDLLGFEEYFSSFVSINRGIDELNHSYHNASNDCIEGLRIVDEIKGNDSIDLMHMFATLSGIWNTYQEGAYIPSSLHSCSDLEDLCGWAGDLQSEIQRQYNNNSGYVTEFESILNGYEGRDGEHVNTNFPTEDFLADQDALNIASIHGNGYTSLKYSMNLYYQYGLQMLRLRDQQFLTNLENHNWTDSETTGNQLLKEKIYTYVGIKENADGTVISDVHPHLYRYSLVPSINNIDVEIRKQFANSFYNYLISWEARIQ